MTAGGTQRQADGTWQASCTFKGRRLSLGSFDSASAAMRAADLGALAEEARQRQEQDRALGACMAARGCAAACQPRTDAGAAAFSAPNNWPRRPVMLLLAPRCLAGPWAAQPGCRCPADAPGRDWLLHACTPCRGGWGERGGGAAAAGPALRLLFGVPPRWAGRVFGSGAAGVLCTAVGPGARDAGAAGRAVQWSAVPDLLACHTPAQRMHCLSCTGRR